MQATASRLVAITLLNLSFIIFHYVLSVSFSVSLLLSLTAAYLPSYLDHSEYTPYNGRLSSTLRHHPIFHTLLSYFPARILYEASPNEYKTHPSLLFAVHPHGIATWNHFMLMTDGVGFLSTGIGGSRRDAAATILFRIPLVRDFLLALGCVDAGAATCHAVLRAGLSLQLYVGGEKEQLLTTPSVHHSQIVASTRRGFIKLACQYDLPIVPVFAFGEERLYYTSSLGLGVRLALAKAARIALPLAWGRLVCPLVPLKRELVTVVGRPFRVEGEGIGEERVEAGLRKYCQEMTALFERNKINIKGYETTHLKIV